MKKKNTMSQSMSSADCPSMLLNKKTPFAVVEAFNQLRTNIMYAASSEETCPVYGITSVQESSGKSTVIVNLALSFAGIGKRVLLIDGDMRCPAIYRFFRMEKKQAGLSELISGIVSDAITQNVMPNLDVITSGRIPPNPSELLNSPKLKELLAQWKQSYDIIFFDFPPMGVVSDCVILCNEVSGYIFTVLSGKDHAKNVNESLENMEQVGAKIVGVVLNNYDLKSSGYYHYRSNYKYRSKYASRYVNASADPKSNVDGTAEK